MVHDRLLESLDADQHQMLIVDSLMFMRTITDLFGADRGMAMWNQLADVVDPALKQEVFMAMLMGEGSRRVRFRRGSTAYEAVAVIKAIRTATGLGLKEAKDLWDASAQNWARVEATSSQHQRQLVIDLRQYGMEVC